MSDSVKRYTSEAIDVTYDTQRCIHAAECVRRLPAVFDTKKRPWIQPAEAAADKVAETVIQCPSGALHFERKDEGIAEAIPAVNSIHIQANGPYYVRGDVRIETTTGDVLLTDVRVALCRCGQSRSKPFCDNSHIPARFEDAGEIGQAENASTDAAPTGKLIITPTTDGSYHVQGNVEIRAADGVHVHRGDDMWLCRCGGSSKKPFCDSTHERIGFKAT